jgi:hypothetical protein
LPHRGFLSKTWTYALEYEFLHTHLRDVPNECAMVGPQPDGQHRGLYIVSQLSALAGRRHLWMTVPELIASRPQGCVVFYRAASCLAWEKKKRDWNGSELPECREVRERFDWEPIAETTLPALPYAWEVYAVDPVPVGLYRVRPKGYQSRGMP